MHAFPWEHGLRLGLLLGAALIGGKLLSYLHFHTVTAYLCVGLIMGRSFLNVLDEDCLATFEPLTALAMGMVLFLLGINLPLAKARRNLKRVLKFSAAELTFTFTLVFVGISLIGLFVGFPWQAALLLGALALPTAPATTILVLKESESEGQVTDYAKSMVVINVFTAIILFELLFLSLQSGYYGVHESPAKGLEVLASGAWLLGLSLVGSTFVGIATGFAVAILFPVLKEERRLVLLISAFVFTLGLCHVVEMPYLLAFLAMGITVANACGSELKKQIGVELDRITGVLLVIFFVVHGADLDISKLPEARWLGIGYLVFRLIGKYGGVRWAARRAKEPEAVQKYLGSTLLAHAGVAIALSGVAVERGVNNVMGDQFSAACLQIQTIILGTIVVFEFLGALSIQHSVFKAGEVPMSKALHHQTGISLIDSSKITASRFFALIGYDPWKMKDADLLTVRRLMRTDDKPIPAKAAFSDLTKVIESSRNNTYAVVDEEKRLIGILRFKDISRNLFDPALGTLVRAYDLAIPTSLVLVRGLKIEEIAAAFKKSEDDCLPVVESLNDPHYIGYVRRLDLHKVLMQDPDSPLHI
jgi:Kef-type K+ transport system membrane component KefB